MPGIHGDGSLFNGYCDTPGTPGFNALKMYNGDGSKIPEGSTITITDGTNTDVYEFRNSHPPAGGTAGRWWIYAGANAAASRLNFKGALLKYMDANLVTPPTASWDTTVILWCDDLGDSKSLIIATAAYCGGPPKCIDDSVTVTCSETLPDVGDVWDRIHVRDHIADDCQGIGQDPLLVQRETDGRV
jgi:hypothetical protein